MDGLDGMIAAILAKLERGIMIGDSRAWRAAGPCDPKRRASR